ncbi:hypothetical protein FHX37_3212 [Haloactinospora alba]|uniref:HicA-like toxin of HicAB toxin-antitoxin system n=1 Tax=Haloactinospora alba TaxID=405555 RepID=A0A543NN03_9ACTN|nr:hypothetical protein [Haloactinospora alba]TQN33208.1 hypothetical protein FHX37_3212 [Haloactinospora alba]
MTGRETDPADHPDKEVREVLRKLAKDGWRLTKEGHWGALYCPCGCLRIQVPGTPGTSSRAARRIAWSARRCPLPPDDPRRRPNAADD